MTSSNPTIVRQFWSHVVNKPESTATFVKNKATDQKPVVVTPIGHYGTVAPAVVIPPPAYREVTWEQAAHIVAEVMIYLREQGVKKGDRVAILAWNSPEWIWIDMAIQSLGATTVPIYPNSASEQVNYILNDSGSKILFAQEADQIAKVDTENGVKTIYFDDAFQRTIDYSGANIPAGADSNVAPNLDPSRQSKAMVEDIVSTLYIGGKLNDDFLGVGAEDVSVLIYTSGSTGIPKGVIQLHKTIAAACLSLGRHGFTFNKNDVYLSYLPLAHVYERVDGTALCMWYGVAAAYCNVEEMADVVKIIKPTILLGVPKVWRKIKAKIDAELDAATGLKRNIIDWALQQKTPGLKRCIADFLVFKKIRAALGGRLRLLLSGGAPIAEDILELFEVVGFNLRQGYGLTESAGACTVNTLDHNRVGSVGRVLDCVQVRIVPMEGQPEGRGIIWLKGDSITPGYWNLPEANEKSFKDGWFDTGDIGYIDDDGYLWITGRAKRLMKTDGGKYVATEKLENAFDVVDLIEFVVPVGDGMPFIGALFFLNLPEAEAIAGPAPSGTDAAAYFASHPEIVSLVKGYVEDANSTLEQWETIKQYTIVPVEATVENGLMTTKRTIKTEQVVERFEPLIDEIYTRKKPE